MTTAAAPLHPVARLRRRAGVFLTVAASLFGALHLYVWARLVWAAALPPLPFLAATLVLVAGWIAVVTAFGARVTGREIPRPLAAAGLSWLGLVFVAFTLTLLTEPLRWVVPEVATSGLSGATGLAVLGVGAFGLIRARAPRRPVVDTPVRGLPAALDGFRVVQLSDVHIGPTVGRGYVERVVALANGQDPDLVVITGDLVDGRVADLADAAAPLAGLWARHGVYFVTGNHEYYSGAPEWCAWLERQGIRVLRNERVRIERDGAGFDLVGVDDLFGGMEPGHGIDLDRALAGRDPSVPAVLLAHQPTVVREAARRGVALQLSGHTHGGQIVPFNLLVSLVQPWMRGLHEVDGTTLYVHTGTGWWGPPLRVGAPGEVATLVLRPSGGPRA